MTAIDPGKKIPDKAALDVAAIRRPFSFPPAARSPPSNAASTQPPREFLELLTQLAPGCESVRRGQSSASQRMTALYEEAYDTIAAFTGVTSSTT